MSPQSVSLKPGVVFLQTLSGGILMDIEADRFLALSTASARVWAEIAAGRTLAEVASHLAETHHATRETAMQSLASQLRSWRRVGLIDAPPPAAPLPVPRRVGPLPVGEVSATTAGAAPLAVRPSFALLAAEMRYRRMLRTTGLASTLVALQGERGCAAQEPELVVLRALRSYHALRRPFRQGQAARDCLPRSLALAAMLRRRGVDATVCIGVVDLPFSSHAWTEFGGRVLNETLVERRRYSIIARF